MDYARIVTTCRMLALAAGDAILEVYNGPDFDVRAKSDASPVTEADERADALISAGLRKAFPDIAIVTEEQAATHGVDAATFFLVDPLDGTKEFIQRRGDFTVNIALIENGTPTRGVVYAPAIGRLFYTDAEGRYRRGDRPARSDRRRPDRRAARLRARSGGAGRRRVQVAPRPGDRRLHLALRRRRLPLGRLVAEVLPRRRR